MYAKFNDDVHFFCSRPEIPFLGKFVQKIKIVSLNWNLVLILIICKIQWWCSLFPFSTKNTFFWTNLVQKIKIFSLSWNAVLKLIRRIQWWRLVFSIFDQNNSFLGQISSKKIKIVCWISDLERRRMGIAANSSILT